MLCEYHRARLLGPLQNPCKAPRDSQGQPKSRNAISLAGLKRTLRWMMKKACKPCYFVSFDSYDIKKSLYSSGRGWMIGWLKIEDEKKQWGIYLPVH